MKHFVVYNDLHLYSTYPLRDFSLSLLGPSFQQANVVLLGDIIDMKNCLNSELVCATRFKECLDRIYGIRYLKGNHELEESKEWCDRGVLFSHGDRFIWPEWMCRLVKKTWSPGMSLLHSYFSFDRWFGSWFWDYKLTSTMLDRIVAAAHQAQCKTVILGHVHPHKNRHYFYKGVNVYVLTRGKHQITVLDDSTACIQDIKASEAVC